MVAVAETIPNRKSLGVTSRRRLGDLYVLMVQNSVAAKSVESEQSVDQRPSLYCSPARLSPLSAAAAASSATYQYDDQGNPDNNLSSLEIGTGLLEETTVTNIAIGTTSAVFGDAGGGLQVELLQQIPGASFANARDVSQLLSGW